MYDRLAHIQKLERRIRNQRIALQQNWEIVEMRMNGRAHYLKPRWFDKVMELHHELREARAEIERLRANQ